MESPERPLFSPKQPFRSTDLDSASMAAFGHKQPSHRYEGNLQVASRIRFGGRLNEELMSLSDGVVAGARFGNFLHPSLLASAC